MVKGLYVASEYLCKTIIDYTGKRSDLRMENPVDGTLVKWSV